MMTPELAPPTDAAAELAKPPRTASTSIVEATYGVSDSEYAILLKTTCKEAPREMAAFFLTYCRRAGLDPFRKHVYLWPQTEQGEKKWQIVTGIDGLRVIASRNPLYRGQAKPTWEYVFDENGNIATFRAEHSKYGNIAGKRMPLSCEVTVYRAISSLAARGVESRDVWLEFTGVARFDEFVKKRDGKIHGNWESQPEHQLRIRAEAMALRMAFPEDVGGLYLEDELADREGQSLQTPVTPAGGTRTAEARERLRRTMVVEDVAPAKEAEPESPASADVEEGASSDEAAAEEAAPHTIVDPKIAPSDPDAVPPPGALEDDEPPLTSETAKKIRTRGVDMHTAQKIVEIAQALKMTETTLVAFLVEHGGAPQLKPETFDAVYSALMQRRREVGA